MSVLVGVPLPPTDDEAVAVVTFERPALEVGVQIEAGDAEPKRSGVGLEGLVEPVDGGGGADGMEVLRPRLDPDGRQMRARRDADLRVAVAEAVSVLAEAVRSKGEVGTGELDRSR